MNQRQQQPDPCWNERIPMMTEVNEAFAGHAFGQAQGEPLWGTVVDGSDFVEATVESSAELSQGRWVLNGKPSYPKRHVSAQRRLIHDYVYVSEPVVLN